MYNAVQVLGYVVGLPLQALIVIALLRGPYRHYPLVFLYAAANLLTSIFEAILFIWVIVDKRAETLSNTAYWIDEQILLALIYLVVISMINEATAGARSRRVVRLLVIGGAVLFAATTFLITYRHGIYYGEWMTSWTRELYFCAAILDLGLWAMLIGMRQKNHLLLILSGALGIMFTGEGIGESVRQLSQSSHSDPVKIIGNLVILLTNLVFLYMWWSAFRVSDANAVAPAKQRLSPLGRPPAIQ